MHVSLQEFHCVSPPRLPHPPLFCRWCWRIAVLHRSSMRAFMRAAVAANLDKTDKLKLLLPSCSNEASTVTTREFFLPLDGAVPSVHGFRLQITYWVQGGSNYIYCICLQSLFNCCSPHCCLHPTPCLPTTSNLKCIIRVNSVMLIWIPLEFYYKSGAVVYSALNILYEYEWMHLFLLYSEKAELQNFAAVWHLACLCNGLSGYMHVLLPHHSMSLPLYILLHFLDDGLRWSWDNDDCLGSCLHTMNTLLTFSYYLTVL